LVMMGLQLGELESDASRRTAASEHG
jgi:hypothetical protein